MSGQILCEPDHEYVYYDKKQEGKGGIAFIEFDQNILPGIETCEDMVLAANIFIVYLFTELEKIKGKRSCGFAWLRSSCAASAGHVFYHAQARAQNGDCLYVKI